MLAQKPDLLHKFYNDTSKLVRVEADGSTSITTTKTGINEKILSLKHEGKFFDITSVDAQESPNMDVHILVTGSETGRDNLVRHFAQSFLLGPMENGPGYNLLHDMFRYVGNTNQLGATQAPVREIEQVVGVPGQVKDCSSNKEVNNYTENCRKKGCRRPIQRRQY